MKSDIKHLESLRKDTLGMVDITIDTQLLDSWEPRSKQSEYTAKVLDIVYGVVSNWITAGSDEEYAEWEDEQSCFSEIREGGGAVLISFGLPAYLDVRMRGISNGRAKFFLQCAAKLYVL